MVQTALYRFFIAFVFFSLCFNVCAQNVYYGPKPPPHFDAPGTDGQIRVEVRVFDDPALGGVKIEEVVFNGTSIQLGEPDIRGYRGAGGFMLKPGQYPLFWRTTSDQSWPRANKYQQTVPVSSTDTWVQVTIQGSKAKTL